MVGCTGNPGRSVPTTTPAASAHTSTSSRQHGAQNFDSRCRVATPLQWQRAKDIAKLRLADDELAHEPSPDGRFVLIQKREATKTLVQLMELPSMKRSTIATLAQGSQMSPADIDDDWIAFAVMPKETAIQLFDVYSYERSTGRLSKIGSSATDPERGAAWGPLAFPQLSSGYALWAQGTADRRSALHRYDLKAGVHSLLDTDINTGEAFSVTGRTVWYMKTDQPTSSTPTFTLRRKDIPTGKDLPVPAELRAASTDAGALAASDDLVIWVGKGNLILGSWSKADGVVQLSHATGSDFIDFPRLVGPFAMWSGGKHETALDLRTGSLADITRSDWGYSGYIVSTGGPAVTIADADPALDKPKGTLRQRADAVIDMSKLDPLPACTTGRGLSVAG